MTVRKQVVTSVTGQAGDATDPQVGIIMSIHINQKISILVSISLSKSISLSFKYNYKYTDRAGWICY